MRTGFVKANWRELFLKFGGYDARLAILTTRHLFIVIIFDCMPVLAFAQDAFPLVTSVEEPFKDPLNPPSKL